MNQFSGFLLANTSKSMLPLEYFSGHRPNGYPTIQHTGQLFGLKQVDRFMMRTDEALEDEEPVRSRKRSDIQTFDYELKLIRGYSKLVILAERKKIAEHFLFRFVNQLEAPRLRKVLVQIEDLVEYAKGSDSEFLVTALHARYKGPDQKLQTMLMFGDEVTDSAVFREHGQLFNFTLCGLGRRLFDGHQRIMHQDQGEIMRIKNDGSVSGSITSKKSAIEFINVINFIVNHGWLDDWVPMPPE